MIRMRRLSISIWSGENGIIGFTRDSRALIVASFGILGWKMFFVHLLTTGPIEYAKYATAVIACSSMAIRTCSVMLPWTTLYDLHSETIKEILSPLRYHREDRDKSSSTLL